MDEQGKPHVNVEATVSFVSLVQLEHSVTSRQPQREEESQRSLSQRVSQWELSGCLSGAGADAAAVGAAPGGQEGEQVEWKVSRVLSHGGAFYE